MYNYSMIKIKLKQGDKRCKKCQCNIVLEQNVNISNKNNIKNQINKKTTIWKTGLRGD